MKIGIISDSHDHHANVLKAIEIFNKAGVKHVLHAGDIVSPFTAKAFCERISDAKFIAVFGNNDGEKFLLRSTIETFGGEIHNQPYVGEVAGKNVFVTHIPNVLDEIIESGKHDLVIYGHTHQQDIREVGNTLVINPGESTDWLTDQSCVVILETDDMSWEVKVINGG